MKTLVLAGALTMALAATASARLVSAAVGRPINTLDAACFGLFVEGVSNNCSTDRSFDVPFDLDTFGNKSASFSFYNAQSQGVSCNLHISDAAGTTETVSSPITQTTTLGNGSLGTPTLTVPGNGRAWLSCVIKPGSRLMAVAYGA